MKKKDTYKCRACGVNHWKSFDCWASERGDEMNWTFDPDTGTIKDVKKKKRNKKKGRKKT